MKFFESVESIFSFIVRWILLERIVFLTWLLIQKFSHSQSKLSSFVISNPLLNNDMLERHGNPFCQHFIEQFRSRILMKRIRRYHVVFENWYAICQSHCTSSNDGVEKFHSKMIQLNWSTVEKMIEPNGLNDFECSAMLLYKITARSVAKVATISACIRSKLVSPDLYNHKSRSSKFFWRKSWFWAFKLQMSYKIPTDLILYFPKDTHSAKFIPILHWKLYEVIN